MNLRRYRPTLFVLGYVLLVGLWMLGSYTDILPARWLLLSAQNGFASFVALRPFTLVVVLMLNGTEWGIARDGGGGFLSTHTPDWAATPSPLGWFVASLLIVGAVFFINYLLIKRRSSGGVSKN